MIRYAAVIAVGYVLGAKAGRRRYEQIASTYRAVTANPATKAVIDAGRRKIAKQVSPDPQFLTLTPIDAETSVLATKESTDGSARKVAGRG
ncbi:hypothetical protein B7435_08865 [Mycolicibacterium peregrinum]|uniref:YtxH domain-containing protein n=2 Tax=Mycolicibacterium peregrinum TaxID=43304 RepID=A0A1A1YUQ0_MYCPR|nr:hypothetical protein [Mycolicibacterium peregrinum]OBB98269.1 hypothetical protein A5779_13380 [Mycolicibacterium peregrinum]OBF35030.1 hypothetical protein A5719_25275 [Mycolicibacterium peregrinum]OWM05777.1 hypothetical protein B7435_08865 [Mycolicibacterium peregrinum]TGB45366.1 hypothetical protein EJD98_07895 [Mycolicibacterium peregrinum]TGB46155.1 hypothetical protein EJD94_04055 [Mycolicibacterium peregrinum]